MKSIIKKVYDIFASVPNFVWPIVLVLSIITLAIVGWHATAYRDIDIIKKEAPSFIKERGWDIVSYDGYRGAPVHGGFVYYQVVDKNGFVYSMGFGEWEGEIMIYDIKCLNAVSSF